MSYDSPIWWIWPNTRPFYRDWFFGAGIAGGVLEITLPASISLGQKVASLAVYIGVAFTRKWKRSTRF
jgi:hypothetical protein